MDFLKKLQKENDQLKVLEDTGLHKNEDIMKEHESSKESHVVNEKVSSMLGSDFDPEGKSRQAHSEEIESANVAVLKSNLEKMHKFIMDFQRIKNAEIKTLHDKLEQALIRLSTLEDKVKTSGSSSTAQTQAAANVVTVTSNTQSQQPASAPQAAPRQTQAQSRSGDYNSETVDLNGFFYAGK